MGMRWGEGVDAMELCGNCGARLRPGDTYCPACGTQVLRDPSVALSAEQRTGRIALVVAGVLVAVLVVLVGGWFAWQSFSRLPANSAATSAIVDNQLGKGGSKTTTASAGGSKTSSATSATVTPAQATPKPKVPVTTNDVTRQATFITRYSIAEGGPTIMTLDYVQFLTGAAAQKAATAKGDTVENDYYVLNDNAKLRRFEVASTVVIVMHPGNGPQFKRIFTLAEFKSLMGAGAVTYSGKIYNWNSQMTFWVNIKNNKLTRIEQQWVP